MSLNLTTWWLKSCFVGIRLNCEQESQNLKIVNFFFFSGQKLHEKFSINLSGKPSIFTWKIPLVICKLNCFTIREKISQILIQNSKNIAHVFLYIMLESVRRSVFNCGNERKTFFAPKTNYSMIIYYTTKFQITNCDLQNFVIAKRSHFHRIILQSRSKEKFFFHLQINAIFIIDEKIRSFESHLRVFPAQRTYDSIDNVRFHFGRFLGNGNILYYRKFYWFQLKRN